jgi:hypothetical protein
MGAGALFQSKKSGTGGGVLSFNGRVGNVLPIAADYAPFYWSLTGNVGTSSVNFLGTTDGRDLFFKTNNQRSGWLNINNNLTFFGRLAGNNNTTGFDNTGVGFEALSGNTIGSNNVAVGRGAIRAMINGTDNTAVGHVAASGSSIQQCTIIGATSAQSGTWNTCTFVGYNHVPAGFVGGDRLHFFGSGGVLPGGGLSNSVALGSNTRITNSNQFVVGGTGADLISNWQINGVDYVMPSSFGGGGSAMTNNGGGLLTWTPGFTGTLAAAIAGAKNVVNGIIQP